MYVSYNYIILSNSIISYRYYYYQSLYKLGELNAVLCWCFTSNLTCVYAELRSKHDNILAPSKDSNESSTLGIGYTSLTVLAFNLR